MSIFGPKNPDATESHQNRIVGAPGHAKTDRTDIWSHRRVFREFSGNMCRFRRCPIQPNAVRICTEGVLDLLNTMVTSELGQTVPFGRKEHLKISVLGCFHKSHSPRGTGNARAVALGLCVESRNPASQRPCKEGTDAAYLIDRRRRQAPCNALVCRGVYFLSVWLD